MRFFLEFDLGALSNYCIRSRRPLGWRIRLVFFVSPFIPLNYRRLAKLIALVGALAVGLTNPGAVKIDFNRDIKPLLSNRCFACHGPDKGKREAKLRLDVFDGATRDLDGSPSSNP